MISEIMELTKINFSSVFVAVFVILIGIKAIVTLFEWVTEKLGLQTKWMSEKKEERKLLKETADSLVVLQNQQEVDRKISNQHDKMIKQDLSNLANTVNGIAHTLDEMQKKNNASELKRLKDTLVRYYNKYKPVGEWSKLEKDAFWDLFHEYEQRGGDGYVHSIIEPVMRELREVD